MAGRRREPFRPLLVALYSAVLVFVTIDWMTPWIHVRVVETSWGWSFQLGPTYLSLYLMTVTSLVVGLSVMRHDMKSWASRSERAQGRGLFIGIMIPIAIGSVTDGVLPMLDIHVWHLGTTTIAVLGAIVAWTFHKYDYSLLAPGMFEREILETLPDGVMLLHLDGRIRRSSTWPARGINRISSGAPFRM